MPIGMGCLSIRYDEPSLSKTKKEHCMLLDNTLQCSVFLGYPYGQTRKSCYDGSILIIHKVSRRKCIILCILMDHTM